MIRRGGLTQKGPGANVARERPGRKGGCEKSSRNGEGGRCRVGARSLLHFIRDEKRLDERDPGISRTRPNIVSPASVSIITRLHYQRCATNITAFESMRSFLFLTLTIIIISIVSIMTSPFGPQRE